MLTHEPSLLLPALTLELNGVWNTQTLFVSCLTLTAVANATDTKSAHGIRLNRIASSGFNPHANHVDGHLQFCSAMRDTCGANALATV